MSNLRTLADFQKEQQQSAANNRGVQSYAGGEKSGIAIDQPVDGGSEIHLYQNGFLLQGQPFRSFSDPANVAIWTKVKQGEMPVELAQFFQTSSTGEVDVRLVEHGNERYPEVESNPSPAAAAAAAFTGVGSSVRQRGVFENVDLSRVRIQCDADEPTTILQFRFHDGSKVRQAFMLRRHTVNDVIQFTARVAPGPFTLYTNGGFPPSVKVTPTDLTVEQANLAGEFLVQKCI